MAFIFGIYEELVFSIKKMSGEVLGLGIRLKFSEAIKATPFAFLIPLGLGLLAAVFTLSSFLERALHDNPTYVWSFFFGLVVMSIIIVRRRVVTWDLHDKVSLVFAAVFAYWLVGLVPVETAATIPAFFFSGAVAVVAMILPGISGSFLLVLMGKYAQVLSAVNDRDFAVLFAVAAGAVIGLSLFSRVLTWLFAKHHDIAVATLTGFMVGSLRKIWPWKLAEENVIPMTFDNQFYTSALLLVAAVVVMYYLDSLQVTSEEIHDIDDPEFERGHRKSIASEKK
jgi:putative membrane protein